ncbi:hypothetical protein GCM10018954_066010 [Kutzneria kofuensis]
MTRRLLEGMLGVPMEKLLRPPESAAVSDRDISDLQARLAASRNLDKEMVELFQQKLDLARVMDRRVGAPALLGELRHQIEHMQQVLRYSLPNSARSALAKVLVDARTLAGWQSLDQGLTVDAWAHYDGAKAAALESDCAALHAYATAAQSVVLHDVGDTVSAVELAEFARNLGYNKAPKLLRSWLNAAYGEACAADGRQRDSLRAFDEAVRIMPSSPDLSETPYLVFGLVHLQRWRGNALARLGEHSAIATLSEALADLDSSFTRAETTLRVDLALALRTTRNHDEIKHHIEHASALALQIGSIRQQQRLTQLAHYRL